jgi:cell wall-associated NlpC family hydrolase
MVARFYIFVFICLFFYACSTLKKTHVQPTASFYYEPAIILIEPKKNIIDSAAIKLALKNKALQNKYARLLGVPADSINLKLYSFINEWIDTRYKWGGTNKNGIDCSAFICRLFNEVYDLKLPRTSLEQVFSHRVEPFISKKYLAEGDILFFRTIKGKIVSHVGFYLRNNRFINSSSSKGVVIYNLNDDYWKSHFVIAARVREKEAKKSLTNITMR